MKFAELYFSVRIVAIIHTMSIVYNYYTCAGAERATTPTILILSSTQNNNNIKSTEFPWIRPSTSTSLRMRPSATTSSWIHPSNSPSAVPGVHHSSHFLVVIVGVTVALLVLLVAAGGLATVIGLIRCKRYQTQTLNCQSSPNGM